MAEVYRKDIPIIAPEFQIVNKSGVTRTKRTGTVVREIAVATFDPSGNTAQRPTAAYGLGVFLPTKAIITKVWYDVVTTFTSAGSDAGTIAFHVQSANDILAAIAISDGTTPFAAGIRGTKIGWPNLGADAAHDSQLEVAALYVATYLKLTAVREITATVGGQALTAGKANVYVEYTLSD